MGILLFQCDFCAIDSSNSRCHGVDVTSAKLMRLKRSASMSETQTFLQVNPVIKMIEGQCMNMLHPLNPNPWQAICRSQQLLGCP